MKWRRPLVFLAFAAITAAGAYFAPDSRYPWVITAALSFIGILIFDSFSEVPRTWPNTLLFIIIYGLSVMSLLETTAENFWRDQAGAVFMITLLFEENSQPWSGLGFLKSMMTPGVLFLLLVFAQTFPFLTASSTFGCAIGAILVFSFLELASIMRENNDLNSGSFMSAVRLAACGVGGLFYAGTFLPSAAKDMPFVYVRVGLPALCVLVALLGLLFRQWRRRYLLFCCNWSVFIFWAAITGEPHRFYAALAALVAGSWSIMMTNRESIDPSQTKELYLKLSAWGIPGSLLFSMIVFVLYPSEDVLVKQGAVLWLFAFFIYWSDLRRFEFPKKAEGHAVWRWQNSLALAVTIAGAAALSGVKYFPDIFSMFWGMTK